jgi:hypothetical protein
MENVWETISRANILLAEESLMGLKPIPKFEKVSQCLKFAVEISL